MIPFQKGLSFFENMHSGKIQKTEMGGSGFFIIEIDYGYNEFRIAHIICITDLCIHANSIRID
jgi:hypothetical protein